MNQNTKTNKSFRKHFITLNLKLAIVVVIALIMTFLVFELLGVFQSFVVDKYYLSEDAVARNEDEAFESLEKTIKSHNMKSTDTELLQRWVKDQEYTYLVVSDNFSIAFDGGWSISTTPTPTEDVTTDQSDIDYDNDSERITLDTFQQDTKNRIVQFEDGPFYVYINVYREEYFYRMMMIVRIALCVLTLIGIIMIYNGRVLGRIVRLSQEVEEVTSGNLTADIAGTANDEIGSLANNVDTMRNYIIKRLQSEKEAWDKNSELITAMSHDIRTPLTSLIGYLDIIESGKYQSKDEEKRYIESCRDKALQLKDLSDKLFQYFLVFGSKGAEKNLEVFDAGILLQQIISEHSAELINYGFNIDLDYRIPIEGESSDNKMEIEADISGLRRLFDNLFSNLTKYADKNTAIRISAVPDEEGRNIVVRIINGVLTESRRVESNKIGLKTCEKICRDMGGSFYYQDEGQLFTVRMNLPVHVEKSKDGTVTIAELAANDIADIHDINIHNVEEVLGTDLGAELTEEKSVVEEPIEIMDAMNTMDLMDSTDSIIGGIKDLDGQNATETMYAVDIMDEKDAINTLDTVNAIEGKDVLTSKDVSVVEGE